MLIFDYRCCYFFIKLVKFKNNLTEILEINYIEREYTTSSVILTQEMERVIRC